MGTGCPAIWVLRGTVVLSGTDTGSSDPGWDEEEAAARHESLSSERCLHLVDALVVGYNV